MSSSKKPGQSGKSGQPAQPEQPKTAPVKGTQTWRQYIAELEDYYKDEIAVEDAAAEAAARSLKYKTEGLAEVQRILKLPTNKYDMVLGVDRTNVTRAQIELAFDRLADLVDPKNNDCKDAYKAFWRVKEAYKKLRDEKKYVC